MWSYNEEALFKVSAGVNDGIVDRGCMVKVVSICFLLGVLVFPAPRTCWDVL